MKLLGIEDSDGQQCECCGAVCPKRRVVLDNGFEVRRLGSKCAAMALTGSKSKFSVSRLNKEAQAHNFAAEHLESHGPEKVAARIRTLFCPALAFKGKLFIGSEFEGKTFAQLT